MGWLSAPHTKVRPTAQNTRVRQAAPSHSPCCSMLWRLAWQPLKPPSQPCFLHHSLWRSTWWRACNCFQLSAMFCPSQLCRSHALFCQNPIMFCLSQTELNLYKDPLVVQTSNVNHLLVLRTLCFQSIQLLESLGGTTCFFKDAILAPTDRFWLNLPVSFVDALSSFNLKPDAIEMASPVCKLYPQPGSSLPSTNLVPVLCFGPNTLSKYYPSTHTISPLAVMPSSSPALAPCLASLGLTMNLPQIQEPT